jgi:protein-S-isoprenylcysteine O-methyltransferase Ste14
MNNFTEKYLPAILFYFVAVLVLAVMLAVRLKFNASSKTMDSFGLFLIYIGVIIILWALVYLRLATFALIETRRKELVTGGPYRFLRHPIYTGTIACFIGAALTLKSWPGLIGTVCLFIPAAVYRGRAEDKALERKFGVKWQEYVRGTGSLLPVFKKRR